MNVISKFVVAVSFLTCLPLSKGANSKDEPDSLSGLSAYLPAVGVLIGLILISCYQVLKTLSAPPQLACVSLWLIWLLVTGGIHFDGLMDTADGIFSHRTRERMLEIMRDSRSGNFAVIAALSVVLLKCAALYLVFESGAWFALMVVPVWARWCEAFAIGAFQYVRSEGMGKIWHDTSNYPKDVLIAFVASITTTVTISILSGTSLTILTSLSCVAAGLSAAYLVRYLLGGHTGDTYGFVVEIAEAGGIFCAAFAALR